MSDRSAARAWFLARVAAGAAATGLLVAPRSGAQPASPRASLRIGIAPSDGVTSVVYAAKAGLFEDAGLDVVLETQSSGAAVADAVASGVYDIGNSSITSVLLAHERGLPFRFVAPAGIYDGKEPTTGALVLANSRLRLGKDADGATLGLVSLSSIGHDAFCAWVDQHGGDSSTLRFVEVPFPLSAAALEQQRVVAAETAAPAMTFAVDTGKFRVIPIDSAIAPLFIVSAWFASADFSGKHPDLVRTFARVVAAAAAYANAHSGETAPIMASFMKIPVEVIEHMPRTQQGLVLRPALIQPVIAAAVKYGSLKKSFAAQDVIDPVVAAP